MDDETQTVPLFQDATWVNRLAVMLYVRLPLSLRNVEDLLHERGIDASHEIRQRCIEGLRSSRWR